MTKFNIKMGLISTVFSTFDVEAETQAEAIEKAYAIADQQKYVEDEHAGSEYEVYTVDGEFPDSD